MGIELELHVGRTVMGRNINRLDARVIDRDVTANIGQRNREAGVENGCAPNLLNQA